MINTLDCTYDDKIAEICDLYTDLRNAWVTLYNADKQRIYPVDTRGQHPYCSMVRSVLKKEHCCEALDIKMMKQAENTKAAISYTCHAGLRETVFPLFVNHHLTGYVMIGKYRTAASPSTSPYAQHWETLQNNKHLQKIFLEKTTLFSAEQERALLLILHQIFELLISNRMIRLRDLDLMAPLIDEIRAHPEHIISLKEAARKIGRSKATLTRLFRKTTGKSFKQYQMENRIEHAKQMLATHSHLPITEIAMQTGFEDPFYFSKFFHEKTGMSPSDYRKRQSTSIETSSV